MIGPGFMLSDYDPEFAAVVREVMGQTEEHRCTQCNGVLTKAEWDEIVAMMYGEENPPLLQLCDRCFEEPA